jgi:hypothetical protein
MILGGFPGRSCRGCCLRIFRGLFSLRCALCRKKFRFLFESVLQDLLAILFTFLSRLLCLLKAI